MLISEVIQNIKNYCKGTWAGHKIDDETTRDKILYGDPDQECTGIVTTIYASIDVIRKAHELGANLIIAHEALLWNHGDHREWLEESHNKTYLDKKAGRKSSLSGKCPKDHSTGRNKSCSSRNSTTIIRPHSH